MTRIPTQSLEFSQSKKILWKASVFWIKFDDGLNNDRI